MEYFHSISSVLLYLCVYKCCCRNAFCNISGGASLVVQLVKDSACTAGDSALIPGSGRSAGEGTGCPLQCSGLKNSMDSIGHISGHSGSIMGKLPKEGRRGGSPLKDEVIPSVCFLGNRWILRWKGPKADSGHKEVEIFL